MQILPPTSETIQEAIRILQRGGVIAHATETCYGFACDLTNPDAVQKLFAIKQRPTKQPVSALFASVEEAKRYVLWNEKAQSLAEKHLPGALTIILPIRSDTPLPLFPTPTGGKTLGVRVSSHLLAETLAKKFGKPLSTTSANVHGNNNPYSAKDIQEQCAQGIEPDLIIDSGTLPLTPPSTVLDLTGNSPNRETKRKGAI